MRFTPSSKRNPCPVCLGVDGDCRNVNELKLILCHRNVDRDPGVPNFRWVKPSSNGVWGVFSRDNGKPFDREKYDRYLAEKRALENDRASFLAENALDANGRDRAIRLLAKYIGLTAQDRRSLRNRGLSDEAIEAGLFFSVDPFASLPSGLPENLPGIDVDRGRFTTKERGIACPALDLKKRAIGWQIRISGAEKGKYRWAKSHISSHLKSDELPVSIVQPPSACHQALSLHLSEGLLKPYVAANRLGIPVLGAAGGYFSGSPRQVGEIISKFDRLVLCPDAGDVLNLQVMRRWGQQIDFLKQFGKPIEVLWWNQVDKTCLDIDEIGIDIFEKSECLSIEEFFKVAEKQQFIEQQKQNWRQLKSFAPQIKIEHQYFNFGLPQANKITLIKSPLGSGKTQWLVEQLTQVQDRGILNVGYRNTLLLQFNERADRLGFYHLQSDKNLQDFDLNNPAIKVSNCVDSLTRFSQEQFDGKIIILDEVSSILKHLLFSGTIKNFSKIKELFTEMLRRCDRIIALDGMMQDWVVTFFKAICPSKEIIAVENVHRASKPKIRLLDGTIDIEENIRVNDKTPWLSKLLSSQVPVVCSDSQIFCEAIENLLIQQGRSGIRVDSKTVPKQHVREFFTDPSRYIEENHPEYVIYSPSAESGLDVPIQNYFSEHFCFFFGAIDIDAAIQMMGRIRDTNVPKYLWCKKFVVSEDLDRRSSNVEKIQADRARSIVLELNAVIEDAQNRSKEQILSRIQMVCRDSRDPYTDAADNITAIRNYEFANYRECLKTQLINAGYEVELLTLDEIDDRRSIGELEKKSKTQVKTQNAADIYNADDRFVGKEESSLGFDADWETRCALMKAKLLSRLPGIDRDPVWSPRFIKLVKYDEPRAIEQIERYHLMNDIETAKRLATLKYNKIHNQGEIAAPWKLRQTYLAIEALRNIGLHEFIERSIADVEGEGYSAETPEILEILRRSQYRKNRQILGTIGKDPIKFFHKLLAFVGIKTKATKTKKDGKAFRSYRLDAQQFYSPDRQAILRSVKLKYDEIINNVDRDLEWVTDAQKSAEKQPQKILKEKMPESIAIQSLDAVADRTYFSIKNNGICHPKNEEHKPAIGELKSDITNELQQPQKSISETRQNPVRDRLMKSIDAELSRLNWTIPQAVNFLIGVYGKRSRLLLSDSRLLDFLKKLGQIPRSCAASSDRFDIGDVITHTVKGRGTIAWVSNDAREAVVVWADGKVSDRIFAYPMSRIVDADSA